MTIQFWGPVITGVPCLPHDKVQVRADDDDTWVECPDPKWYDMLQYRLPYDHPHYETEWGPACKGGPPPDYVEGDPVQFLYGDTWRSTRFPLWQPNCTYRIRQNPLRVAIVKALIACGHFVLANQVFHNNNIIGSPEFLKALKCNMS